MGESIDVWREFFRTTDTDVFEFIDKAITIVALDCPKDFLSQRGRIAERLFSYQMTEAGGDCTLKSKESKANGDSRGNASCDVVSVNCSHGEAETFSDYTKETSEIVCEVLKIKRVLENSTHESELALHESLKQLQSMTITVDILEKTKIGISVNNLQRNCGSKQITQLAHNITRGWKAMVALQFQNPNRSIAGCRRPFVTGQDKVKCSDKGIVKPNMSSNSNSRITAASKVASWKFEDRILQSQDSNGSVMGCKRLLACRQDVIECCNEVVADMKFAATKRKMQELYQKIESDKRRRTVQVLDPRDLPKMASSHKAPSAATKKACPRRVILRNRVG